MNTLVIYGPPGSGKTTNAEALANHYGCSVIHDSWEPGLVTPACFRGGDLVLTNQPVAVIEAHFQTADLVSIEDALMAIRPAMRRGAGAISNAQKTLPPEGDGSDHWTCGNGWLAAERTLRLIEQTSANAPAAIEAISDLVHQAGPRQARQWLDRADHVPF